MRKDFILTTGRNDEIKVSAYGYENIDTSPCIICIHGFKGFKDWGFWPYTAEYFAGKGFFVLTFNFSHNGIGENLTEFTEIDKFAENTISLEVEELTYIVSSYKEGYFGKTKNNRIGFLGHSRGGGVALLASRQVKDINAVAVWASVSKFDRYTEHQKREWKEKGVFEVVNSRTKQVMKLNLTLLEDIEKNKDDYLNVEKAVKALQAPLFIAHGEQDLTVPISDAENIYTWSDKENITYLKIPAAGHTFTAVHPFEGSTGTLDYLLTNTEKFFKTNLN